MAFFILTLHVGKPEAATQGREVPQRVRNCLVPNRLVNDVPCRPLYRGVLSPNDFEQLPSKGRSVFGRRRGLLRRCPLSLDEGYHRSDVGLVKRLLVAGAKILYLDCAGCHFRFSADGQESDVLAVGVIELLFEF